MTTMSRVCRTALFALLLASGWQAATPAALAQSTTRVQIVSVEKAGTTYADLSARWWQWVLSIPVDRNPNLDATGANCAEGQTGTVWFLAGSFGDDPNRQNPTRRACNVPAGRYLFFPLLNVVGLAPFDYETVLDLRSQAEAAIAGATLECLIDGKRVPDLADYRVTSPSFSTLVRANSLLAPGMYDPMVSDGFWLLVPPLSKGTHTISFYATAPGIVVNVAYVLTIG